MEVSSCIHEFFTHYLKKIRGLSSQTLSSYKTTFKLLLPFAAKYLNKKINSIEINDLSTDLILSFLDFLESDRKNCVRTRNIRLAAIKSLAKMIRLLHPEFKEDANRMMNIPQKRESKPLVGFLSQEELLDVFNSVDLQKKDGFRDYVILHLLYDSGARATEITDIKIDDINVNDKTVAILGKGQRYRIVQIWEKTIKLVERYAKEYRNSPKLGYQDYLFINQRGEKLTRHGIYRICKKYLSKALPEKRLKNINSVHSFRHSCAVHMLMMEKPISDIKNHLGHEDIKSTMIYLKIDHSKRKEVQKKYIEHMEQVLETDDKINELIDWENSKDVLEWLDNL
ncbi:Integrase, catalytic core, phage domain protein [Candidatus Magnetomorum sp. HK-1]|nr:Integrase, catalytic core, phage domain protein [Candidatus Magnetomorum sp. HK-1]